MSSVTTAMNTMADFINSINQRVKQAEAANTEPGSIGGETSHPSKDVDDNTEVAQTGERAAENEKDVKEDQGAPGVDSRPDVKTAFQKLLKRAEGGSAAATPGSAADDQIQVGTNKQPTGEDPSNETSSVKGGKKDPGSTHPARTDNDNLAGGKYAADTPREKLAQEIERIGRRLCDQMNDGVVEQYQKTSQARQAPSQQSQNNHDLAYNLGNELASMLNGTMNKQAADAMVQRTLAQIIKRASDDAENYATFVYEQEEQRKIANDAMLPVEQMAGGNEGGGLPMGGGSGEDEASMLAALGGGEGAEPDGDEGMMGDEGDQEIDPEALQQLLEQLGVSDDDVQAGTEEELAAGSGDADVPPETPPVDPTKMGSDRGKKSGKTAKDNTVDTLREMIQRSRNAR